MSSSSLYISSRDRIAGTNSSFILPQVQIPSSGNYRIDVEQVIFPKAQANVRTVNNRPVLGFGIFPAPAASTQVSVANALPPNVFYDGTSLATALTTMLTAHCGFAVTVTYSSTTYKLSISIPAGNCLYFQSTQNGDITSRFLEITGWQNYNNIVLGGAGATTYPTIAAGVTSFDCSPVKLTDTDWVDVVANFTTFSYTTSQRKSQILQRIPTTNALGTMCTFEEKVTGTVSMFTGSMIQNMSIALYDEWGDEYTLPQGFALSIVLTLTL
jgi:hypothetical protein